MGFTRPAKPNAGWGRAAKPIKSHTANDARMTGGGAERVPGPGMMGYGLAAFTHLAAVKESRISLRCIQATLAYGYQTKMSCVMLVVTPVP